jgi:hypothetical protein
LNLQKRATSATNCSTEGSTGVGKWRFCRPELIVVDDDEPKIADFGLWLRLLKNSHPNAFSLSAIG